MLFSLLLVALQISTVQAHSFSTDLGTVESIQAGHYHFHLPIEFDLSGSLGFHFGGHSESAAGAHADEAGHSDHGGLSATLVLAADYDRIRREMVRTRVELPPESWQVPLASSDAPRFKLRIHKFAFGLGPDVHMGVAAFGLLPGRETSFFHRIPCATSACDEEFDRRFPEEISDWIMRAPGERMSYARATGFHGTVLGGVHGVVSGGPAFLKEKIWGVVLEKRTDGLLDVTVSEDRLFSSGLELESSIAAVMPGKQRTKGKGYEFTLDPSTADGAEAYRNILAGELDRVATDRRSTTRSFARAFSAQIGIPMVTGVGAESNRNTVSVSSKDETVHVTVRQDAMRARGLLSRHLIRGRYLIASVDEHGDDHGGAHADDSHDRTSFTALWVFERDRVSPESLVKWLRKTAKRAGMPELNLLRTPREKSDYLRAELRILFPEALILQWLGLGSDERASFVELPPEVTETGRWRRIVRRARRAMAAKDFPELSQAIEQAGVEWTDHFSAIRKRAVDEGRPLPVVFELRLLGESIPQTVKAWRLEGSGSNAVK